MAVMYEFICWGCQSVVEESRKLGNTEPPTCDKCNAKMERFFSSKDVVYNCGGFYCKDNEVK